MASNETHHPMKGKPMFIVWILSYLCTALIGGITVIYFQKRAEKKRVDAEQDYYQSMIQEVVDEAEAKYKKERIQPTKED